MAEWESLKIHDVIQEISNNIIVLPVIQRNLVWDEERMELLFDSLLKGNSFGGIMALEEDKGGQPLFAFRQFSKEGEMKDSDLPEILDHNITLIIDGQQRLQAFYMGLMGGVNGKTLYFNLFSQDDYDFEFAGKLSDLPLSRKEDGQEIPQLWYSVKNLYTLLKRVGGNDHKVAFDIISNRNIQEEDQKEHIYRNVHRFERMIFGMKSLGISKVYIDQDNLDEERRNMVELFRRLNNGGTILRAMDLIASTLKGLDYRLEGFLRRDIPQFSDIGFGQDEVIKLIFLLRKNLNKEVTDINKEDAEFVVKNTARIIKTLEVVRQLLKDAGLYEYYQNGGRTVIPLYFVAYHIFNKPNSLESLSRLYAAYDTNDQDFTNIKRWLYLSLLNNVFSRGKGWIPYKTGIRYIFNTIARFNGELFPTDEIFSMYESYPLIFNSVLDMTQIHHWDMTFTFYLIYGGQNFIGRDIDHIQPKYILNQANIPAEKIHSISNYQLIDFGKNRGDKKAKILIEWLKDWKETELKDYLEKHLIPKDSNLWTVEKFDSFLNKRSEMIAKKISDVIPAKSTPAKKIQSGGDKLLEEPTSFPDEDGARQIPNSVRDAEAWLTRLAERNDFGEEFRQVVTAAREAGMYARFQNNWWVVKFTQKENHNNGLFYLGPDQYITILRPAIAEYLNCDLIEVEARLPYEKLISREDVPKLIENLNYLFSKRNLSGGQA